MSPRPSWTADPNGPAYRTDERRVGPPLDHVGSRGSEDDVDRLARMTPDDFRRWPAFVEREGSVSGA